MALKQISNSNMAPDGSLYVVMTDGGGNLAPSIASGGAVTQSGTWTVQPGNTANTTPWVIDQTNQSTLVAVPAAYTFQRPADATPYVSGDLIANSTTAGSVIIPNFTGVTIAGAAGSGEVLSVSVISSFSVAQTIRIHLYHTTAPTVANGDNGAAQVSNPNADQYIGYVDVAVPASVINAGGPAATTQCVLPYKMASGNKIYAVLESQSAFVPGNAAFYSIVVRVRRYS